MSLRLVEVTVTGEDADDLDGLLEDAQSIDVWTVQEGPDRHVVRLLVPTEHTEEVTDRLEGRFGGSEGFRVVLLGAEATLPTPDQGETGAETRAPKRVSREELYEDLSAGSRITAVYLVTVALSAIVAAVGMIRDDVAVVIGAMVIAPLLAPNVALSLAATLGDGRLAVRALKATATGVALVLAVSVLLGLTVPFDETAGQLLGRSRVGVGDAALALAAGSAGALAYTSGLPTAVIGVMVAVALLPPLVAVGLFLGSGSWAMALGAGLLTLTNVTAVNLAGVVTFLWQRVRPRSWWEEEKAKRASRIALIVWIGLLLLLVALMIWVVGDPRPVERVT